MTKTSGVVLFRDYGPHQENITSSSGVAPKVRVSQRLCPWPLKYRVCTNRKAIRGMSLEIVAIEPVECSMTCVEDKIGDAEFDWGGRYLWGELDQQL